MDDAQVRALLRRALDDHGLSVTDDTAFIPAEWIAPEHLRDVMRWVRERGGRMFPDRVPEQFEVPSVALQPPAGRTTGPMRVVLDHASAGTLREFVGRPTGEVIDALESAPIPASEATLGALMLKAIDDLREATNRLDTGTSQLLTLTRWLVGLAGLTLGRRDRDADPRWLGL